MNERAIPGRARLLALFFTVAASSGAAALLTGCPAPDARAVQTLSAELSTGEPQAAGESDAGGPRSSALVLADREVMLSPENAWGHYDRAVALHRLRQTKQAVDAYREAEARFGDARWGKSLAIYGRARAFDDAGRCDEAREAYEEFAALVQTSDPATADMARGYARLCRMDEAQPGDSVASNVAVAIVARDYARALSLADQAQATADKAPRPWLDYNRGVALAGLQRTDEAVRAFQSAERGFAAGDGGDLANGRGRSLAIYGRARALDAASRCAEARKAYAEYTAIAGVADRRTAELTLSVAARCEPTR